MCYDLHAPPHFLVLFGAGHTVLLGVCLQGPFTQKKALGIFRECSLRFLLS